MPQLVLEYSSNILPVGFKELFLECHRVLETVGQIRIGNCKSRAVERKDFLIGDGTDPKGAFIHIDLSFAAERTVEIKKEIGKGIMKIVKKHFTDSLTHLNLQITVKVTSIQKETYFKEPEGTLSGPMK